MKNNILNIQINIEEVVNKIDVSFKRKGVLYTKDIYVIIQFLIQVHQLMNIY